MQSIDKHIQHKNEQAQQATDAIESAAALKSEFAETKAQLDSEQLAFTKQLAIIEMLTEKNLDLAEEAQAKDQHHAEHIAQPQRRFEMQALAEENHALDQEAESKIRHFSTQLQRSACLA